MEGIKPKRLDNLCVVVSDFEASVAFYREVLRLELRDGAYRPDTRWAMLDAGNLDIVLLGNPEGGTPSHRTSAYWENPAGWDSFAFEVTDIDAAMVELDAARIRWAGDLVIYGNGMVLDEVPAEPYPGVWYRYRSFYDHEGNMLHLTEPHEPDPPADRRLDDGAGLRLRRIDNLDFVVRDFDAQVEFFQRVLGCKLYPDSFEPDKQWAMFWSGNVNIVLLGNPQAGEPKPRTPQYSSSPAGFDSLAFEVADLDSAMKALDDAHVTWAGELVIEADGELLDEAPSNSYDGLWYRFRSFYDPEGNMLHVTEPHAGARA
jgi:glyoxylase I family protein